MAATKDLENIKVKEEPSTQTAAGEVYRVGVVILRWEKGEPEFWIGRMDERIKVVEKEVEDGEESWQAAAKAVLIRLGREKANLRVLVDDPPDAYAPDLHNLASSSSASILTRSPSPDSRAMLRPMAHSPTRQLSKERIFGQRLEAVKRSGLAMRSSTSMPLLLPARPGSVGFSGSPRISPPRARSPPRESLSRGGRRSSMSTPGIGIARSPLPGSPMQHSALPIASIDRSGLSTAPPGRRVALRVPESKPQRFSIIDEFQFAGSSRRPSLPSAF